MWALATALKTPVCLLNGADGRKPSPISCRSAFLCSFSPIRTVGKSGWRAELSFLPISPNQCTQPHSHSSQSQTPLDAQFQSPSSVGAVGPLVFCRERDKDHHLPPSPCTANTSAPDPDVILLSRSPGEAGGESSGKKGEIIYGRKRKTRPRRSSPPWKTVFSGLLLLPCVVGVFVSFHPPHPCVSFLLIIPFIPKGFLKIVRQVVPKNVSV